MKTFVDVIVAAPTSDGGPRLDVNFKMGPIDDNVRTVEDDSTTYIKNADLTIRMTIKQATKLRKKLKAAIEATL